MTAPAAAATARPRGSSLGAQLALLVSVVAAVVVIVTAIVAYPLVSAAAQTTARTQLASQADLLAELVGRQDDGTMMGSMMAGRRLRQLLSAQGIEAQVVPAGAAPTAPVTDADVAATQSGGTVSDVRATSSGEVFVEGRPTTSGSSVFLVQDAGVASSQSGFPLRRLLVAAVVGLGVALLIAFVAARRLVRPLRRAADAAQRMSAGARDVALPVEGPQEVASVSESLNRLSAALSSSERRQRDFLLSVSHELRTPLTGITGYAEALADGVVAPQDVPATGATVLGEAHRLERLVADLLDLARLDAVDLRLAVSDVDLAALCREAGEVWRARCEKADVRFTLVVPDSLAVRADPLRVRQVVDNLCENALRVTPAGSPVVLAAGRHQDVAVLEVRDGGPGLTDDDVAVAFEPAALYERYRGVRQVGTGVGLALVGRLAARMGGRAFAGTAPEGGARIGVTLPLALPPRAFDVPPPVPAPTLGP